MRKNEESFAWPMPSNLIGRNDIADRHLADAAQPFPFWPVKPCADERRLEAIEPKDPAPRWPTLRHVGRRRVPTSPHALQPAGASQADGFAAQHTGTYASKYSNWIRVTI